MASSDQRFLRAEDVIRSLAAEFLERTSNRTSLVTVTGIDLSPDERRVVILLSALPDHALPGALDFANRQSEDFRTFLKERSRLRIIPSVRFAKDIGEANRQHVSELLAQEGGKK